VPFELRGQQPNVKQKVHAGHVELGVVKESVHLKEPRVVCEGDHQTLSSNQVRSHELNKPDIFLNCTVAKSHGQCNRHDLNQEEPKSVGFFPHNFLLAVGEEDESLEDVQGDDQVLQSALHLQALVLVERRALFWIHNLQCVS
jgi:hypothetical protein